MTQSCSNVEVWQEESSRLVWQQETWASSYSSAMQDGTAVKTENRLGIPGGRFGATMAELTVEV